MQWIPCILLGFFPEPHDSSHRGSRALATRLVFTMQTYKKLMLPFVYCCTNYSACRRLKMPPFLFFSIFFGVESWAAAHGLYRCAVYRLISVPMSTRLLNSISSRICRQNTQFNMYTTTCKQQEGCTFKDSHPKCFITTNFDKFHCEAFARGGESRWCFDSMFPWYTKSMVNSNGVCNCEYSLV